MELRVTQAVRSIQSRKASNGQLFGVLPNGRRVEVFTLLNRNGLQAKVLDLGASLHSMLVPDRNGRFADVLLGHASLEGMLEKPQYFGATVGRFANRIAGGRFTLDGTKYSLTQNEGRHCLHGGMVGFDRVLWTVVRVSQNHV
ncbi:MAG: galactose-1-epimerase, partial [Oxalobacteraceae bacterium]